MFKNLATLIILTAALTAAEPESLQGRWAATLTQGELTIPFRLDISGSGGKVVGTLYNGRNPQTTTSGSFRDGKLELNFDHYLTSIRATLKAGELEGQIVSASQRAFRAKRYTAQPAAANQDVPAIGGVWEIAQDSPTGEKAWRLIVEQNGAEILATILRVDGDTGGLTGGWQDGRFVASHFDGARPGLLELIPQTDGSLQVKLNGGRRFGLQTAWRPEIARAKGLPEPANYLTHTTVRDPNEVFTYRFPDVNGKIRSNDDPQFKGKVVLAVVTGTWCPNCHDEAQYLVKLYSKYRAQGLEIVALDFEEPDQQNTLTRVKAFLHKYGVQYPYLIAGEPSEVLKKIPQAVNLNTWPATFFIGRDGRVKSVHSGFAAPATGIYHEQLKQEFTSTIERLL